jgi:hypothetical protein
MTADSQRALMQLTAMMHAAGYRDHADRLYRRGEVMAMEKAQMADFNASAANGHSPPTGLGVEIKSTAPRTATSPGLTAMVNLAELHAARGNYVDAIRLHRRVLRAEEEAVGVDSMLLIPRLHALAAVLDASGDHHEALCVRERILSIQGALEEV